MPAWSAFVPLVAPYADGVAEITVEALARQAAITFLTRSLAHAVTLDPTPVPIGVGDIDLDLDTGVCAAKLLAAWYGGSVLSVIRADDYSHTDIVTQAGRPQSAYMVDGRSVVSIRPVPSIDGLPLVARVALRPTLDSRTLDDGIFDQYGLDIAAGAISMAMSQPGRSHFNPGLLGHHGQQFEQAIARARAMAFYGGARAATRARHIYF